jgi:hypothetical protein
MQQLCMICELSSHRAVLQLASCTAWHCLKFCTRAGVLCAHLAGLSADVHGGATHSQCQPAAGGGAVASAHSLRAAAARAVAGAAGPHLLGPGGARQRAAGVWMQEAHWLVAYPAVGKVVALVKHVSPPAQPADYGSADSVVPPELCSTSAQTRCHMCEGRASISSGRLAAALQLPLADILLIL